MEGYWSIWYNDELERSRSCWHVFFFPSPFCISNGFREHVVSPIQIHDPVLQVEFPFVLTSVNLQQRGNEWRWVSRVGGHCFILWWPDFNDHQTHKHSWIPALSLAVMLIWAVKGIREASHAKFYQNWWRISVTVSCSHTEGGRAFTKNGCILKSVLCGAGMCTEMQHQPF